MSLEYLKTIRFVAHAHNFRFNDRILLPVEIGLAQVLHNGVDESEGQTWLITVDYSRHSYMTSQDLRPNRAGSHHSSTLPVTYNGETQLKLLVGYELLAVKGEEAQRYFESIGVPNVVENVAKSSLRWRVIARELCNWVDLKTRSSRRIESIVNSGDAVV